MRRRSFSIHADDEEEYIKILKEEDNKKNLLKSKKSKFSEKIKEHRRERKSFQETINDDLSCFHNYEIKQKELSLFEQEQNDLENILCIVENLNSSFKNKDKNKFIEGLSKLFNEKDKEIHDIPILKFNKSSRSLSYDDIESNEYERRFLQKINLTYQNSQGFSNCSTNNNSIQSLISQNLETFQHRLKIMVIGDKQAGKTLLINKIIQNELNNLDYKYSPTRSLDIRKHILDIMDNTVMIEFWDTCVEILSSSIVNTYYKICNGFLLVCNANNLESIIFLEKHLKNIINSSSVQKTIMLIANNSYSSEALSDIEIMNNKKCVDYMNNISSNYNLKFNLLDLNNFNYKNSNFQKFFDFTFIRLPISLQKKKIPVEQSSASKEVEKEKSLFKPIANSFVVNNNCDEKNNEGSLYLKKESLSQKSLKGKCLII